VEIEFFAQFMLIGVFVLKMICLVDFCRTCDSSHPEFTVQMGVWRVSHLMTKGAFLRITLNSFFQMSKIIF